MSASSDQHVSVCKVSAVPARVIRTTARLHAHRRSRQLEQCWWHIQRDSQWGKGERKGRKKTPPPPPQPPSARPVPAHPVSFCISTMTFHHLFHHQYQLKMNPISKTDCMLYVNTDLNSIFPVAFWKRKSFLISLAFQHWKGHPFTFWTGWQVPESWLTELPQSRKLRNLTWRQGVYFYSKYFLICESSV